MPAILPLTLFRTWSRGSRLFGVYADTTANWGRLLDDRHAGRERVLHNREVCEPLSAGIGLKCPRCLEAGDHLVHKGRPLPSLRRGWGAGAFSRHHAEIGYCLKGSFTPRLGSAASCSMRSPL
jgi:hypothetical protein